MKIIAINNYVNQKKKKIIKISLPKQLNKYNKFSKHIIYNIKITKQ